jgi:predicted enzyme related to lactoylglutathione lyase
MVEVGEGDSKDRMTPWAYVLAVQDIDRSAGYFCTQLGFQLSWAEASDWRLVARGNVRIMLGQCPNERAAAEIGDHSWFAYVEVADVDALHGEFVTRGAIVRQAPADKPYGMREMLVATPDGHRIMFGQDMQNTRW